MQNNIFCIHWKKCLNPRSGKRRIKYLQACLAERKNHTICDFGGRDVGKRGTDDGDTFKKEIGRQNGIVRIWKLRMM